MDAFLRRVMEEHTRGATHGGTAAVFRWAVEAVDREGGEDAARDAASTISTTHPPPSSGDPSYPDPPPHRRRVVVGGACGLSYWGVLIVTSVVVAPAHRRRGVGGALLDAAVALAAKRGCTCAVADAFGDRVACQALLRSTGWALDYATPGWAGGQELQHYSMRVTPLEAASRAEGAAC